MAQRKYDSTLARIAGNIVGSLLSEDDKCKSWEIPRRAIEEAVKAARAIVAEIERTEPKADEAS